MRAELEKPVNSQCTLRLSVLCFLPKACTGVSGLLASASFPVRSNTSFLRPFSLLPATSYAACECRTRALNSERGAAPRMSAASIPTIRGDAIPTSDPARFSFTV